MGREKVQASIEYLYTYGWTILIVLLIIGALVNTGIFFFGPPRQCSIVGDFSCTDFNLKADHITLLLTSNARFTVDNVAITLNSQSCPVVNLSHGALFSGNDISVSGSSSTITGGTLYTTTFSESGSDNMFNPSPTQFTGSPTYLSLDDYKPGGSAALAAQSEGKYTQITGDLDDPSSLDGLYYVTGDVELATTLTGTFTIAAEGNIQASASDIQATSYSNSILFITERSGNNAIKVSGSDSVFQGYLYAPNGDIEVSGSSNTFTGGFVGSSLQVSGSSQTIVYTPLPNEPFKLLNSIPPAWSPGQATLLIFECQGQLARNFNGFLQINYTQNGIPLTNAGRLSGPVY